ncbi:MAG: PepSY-associated TM helix domain-containing protein [Gemmataceae bacterium]
MTHAHRLLLKWARTLHVYLTLFGFVLLLFFAVTGFMLNHENWFLPAQTTVGKLPPELLLAPAENRDAIIEALRADFGVAPEMEVEAFEVAADSVRVVLKSPTGDATATIRRSDGETVATIDSDSQSREHVTIVEGKLPVDLLVPADPAKALPIVERLRKDFQARGEVNVPPTYEKETESFAVVFKAPGYHAKATIRAGDGYTKVVHQARGLSGVLLDLHRGKESGGAWSFVIDGTSILFVIVSITGLILWSSLKSRAQHGLAILLTGLALTLAVYFASVPR